MNGTNVGQMRAEARGKLSELIEVHGISLVQERKRCEALLRDVCSAYRREANLFICALQAGIPGNLLIGRTVVPDILLPNQIEKLGEEYAIAEEAARWTVEAWAISLGIATEETCAEMCVSKQDTHVIASPPIHKTPVSRPDPVWRIISLPNEGLPKVELEVHNNLIIPPSDPIWHRSKAEQVKSYIIGEETRPLLLIGSEHFGGSFITHWATKQANAQLGNNQSLNVSLLKANVTESGLSSLWITIGYWFVDILSKPEYTDLKPLVEEALRPFFHFPVLETELEIKEEWRGSIIKVPAVLGTSESGYDGGSIIYRLKLSADVPSRMMGALRNVLAALDAGQQEVRSRFLGMGKRERSLPKRVVLLLDKVADYNHLRELFYRWETHHTPHRNDPLRWISVVNQRDYLGWISAQNEDGKQFLNKHFHFIEFPPV